MNTTVENNNTLIAEFMGVDSHFSEEVYKDSKSVLRQHIHNRLKKYGLLFHSSWDWLMPVVEKIESIVLEEVNDTSFDVTIGATCYCVIQDNNGGMVEFISDGKSKIEAVYNTVVKFINWYNSAEKQ